MKYEPVRLGVSEYRSNGKGCGADQFHSQKKSILPATALVCQSARDFAYATSGNPSVKLYASEYTQCSARLNPAAGPWRGVPRGPGPMNAFNSPPRPSETRNISCRSTRVQYFSRATAI